MDSAKIRNIAIIAHVDHGKTTLVDFILKQAHVFAAYQAEMKQTTILDSNDLEREKGVTILAKNTSVEWQGYKINILDTPGHADFSGEVERVLNMADGCLLLVDSAEGVLSQTRYVLSLAFNLNLKLIVVINKVDRKDQRAQEVKEEINDLFLELATIPEQLDFPVLYAIGKQGIVGSKVKLNPDHSLAVPGEKDISLLFKTIINTIPSPQIKTGLGFLMQVTTLDYDSHRGRYVIGKLLRGEAKVGNLLKVLKPDNHNSTGKIEYLYTFKGLKKEPIAKAQAGDIIALCGFPQANIGDTLSDPINSERLPALLIAEPTIQIEISPSNSPLVGKDGKFTTNRQIKERIIKELETNVGLRLSDRSSGERLTISGRGELHLAILIETMRREGYEFSVSRPKVILKKISGLWQEPWEWLTIEVQEQFTGIILNLLDKRRAEMINMQNLKTGVRMEYKISTENLIGLRSEILTKTSGSALIHSRFLGYQEKGEEMIRQRNGVLVSVESGQALSYSLEKAQHRGIIFIEPGEEVYTGMIVGQANKQGDIWMNVCKGKKLTNMRAAAADFTIKLATPVKMSLEQCLNFLDTDELLEVTPKHLRLRKTSLHPNSRRF